MDEPKAGIPQIPMLPSSGKIEAMLRAFQKPIFQSTITRHAPVFARMESNGLGWEDIKTIRANKWPVLKGEAEAEKSKLVKSGYLKKRFTNIVPKWGYFSYSNCLERVGR